jgi:anti-sigma-K factor RskA
MHEHLVGYVCGALEEEEFQAIQQLLDADQEIRRRLEMLRRFLAPLECEREECCPPPGLATRVCQCVATRDT